MRNALIKLKNLFQIARMLRCLTDHQIAPLCFCRGAVVNFKSLEACFALKLTCKKMTYKALITRGHND